MSKFVVPMMLVLSISGSILIKTNAALASPKVSPSPNFFGLGYLPDPRTESWANGISGDGSVVIGYDNTDAGGEAFRWTASEGMRALDNLGTFSAPGYAYGVSADGNVIVGYSRSSSSGQNFEAYRWTMSEGMVGLGDLSGGLFHSGAMAASNNGEVIVGWGSIDSGEQAMRWTQGSGMVGIGFLGGTPVNERLFSYAVDVSADGNVIAGWGSSGLGVQAFRWKAGEGLIGLGSLPGSPTNQGYVSNARAISADGRVIVGDALNAAGDNYEAFMWTESTGMVGLGFLPGAPTSGSAAVDVSADGMVVVGSAIGSDNDITAVRWIDGRGPYSITESLRSLGVNIGFRKLYQATGVSADGTIMSGYGTGDGTYNSEAWWAALPIPTNGCLNSMDRQRNQARQSNRGPCSTGRAGLMTASSLNSSLKGLASIPTAALQATNHNMAHTLATDAPVDRDTLIDRIGKLSIWGGSEEKRPEWDKHSATAQDVSLGVYYQATSAISLGFRSYRNATAPSRSRLAGRDGWSGVSASFTYAPLDSGVRLYGGALSDHIEERSTREYMHGVGQTTSGGLQQGRTAAAAIKAGWEIGLDSISAIPFASYETYQIDLQAYEEGGGAFPIAFDSMSASMQLMRLGAEVRSTSENLSLSAAVNWSYRLEHDQSNVNGRIDALSLPLSVQPDKLSASYTEASVRSTFSFSSDTQVRAELQASADETMGTSVQINLGADLRF